MDVRLDIDDSSMTDPSVGHNLILAHANAAKLYDQKYRSSQKGHISITLNGDWVEPYDSTEQSN